MGQILPWIAGAVAIISGLVVFVLAKLVQAEGVDRFCWNCGGRGSAGWIRMHNRDFCSIGCVGAKRPVNRSTPQEHRAAWLRRTS